MDGDFILFVYICNVIRLLTSKPLWYEQRTNNHYNHHLDVPDGCILFLQQYLRFGGGKERLCRRNGCWQRENRNGGLISAIIMYVA